MIHDIGFDSIIRSMAANESFGDDIVLSDFRRKISRHMQTMRLDAVTIFICQCGEISITVNYRRYSIKKGMLMQLTNRHVIDNIQKSADFSGYLLIVSPKLIQSVFGDIPVVKKMSVNLYFQPLLELAEEEMRYLVSIVTRISKILNASAHPFREYILKGELTVFLFELMNINLERNKNDNLTHKPSRREETGNRFVSLIIDNCREQHELSFYADELNMTAGNLSRIMKTISGKPAGKWIDGALTTEARLLLLKPNTSIQEVSEELNFGDQSSFCKFFKKNTGLTPLEYRNRTE